MGGGNFYHGAKRLPFSSLLPQLHKEAECRIITIVRYDRSGKNTAVFHRSVLGGDKVQSHFAEMQKLKLLIF